MLTDKLRTEYDKVLTRASADRTPAGVVVSRDIQRIVYDNVMQVLMENSAADRQWLQVSFCYYISCYLTLYRQPLLTTRSGRRHAAAISSRQPISMLSLEKLHKRSSCMSSRAIGVKFSTW